MKPELAELPVLATLSNLRLMSSLRSHPELERRALPSWDCGCYQSHARVNFMRHRVKSLLEWIYCLPCKPQSHPSYFSSSWKGFHTCRIPQLSLMDLSVHQTNVKTERKCWNFAQISHVSKVEFSVNLLLPPRFVQAPSRLTTLRWWPIWIRIFSSDIKALHSLFVAPAVEWRWRWRRG